MLTVKLSSVGNPDFGQNPRRPLPGVKSHTIGVVDFADASRVCQEYIKTNNLGGGNWNGGEITNEAGETVGHVSYNGRVWPPGKWVPGMKPLFG